MKVRTSVFLATLGGVALCTALVYLIGYSDVFSMEYNVAQAGVQADTHASPPPTLDRAAYDRKLLAVANNPAPKQIATTSVAVATSSSHVASTSLQAKKTLWPASAPYPKVGALLPFNRIVAYYGNFYSTKMGVLGEYLPDVVLAKLASTTAQWEAADPTTPVVPAIDYIAVTAQASAGRDGKYRLRMPDSEIQKALDLAARVHGIVILELQVGLSNVQTEVPLLSPYLKLPNVHLALDPEFAMHGGARPGTVIGSFDAADINFAAHYLAALVQGNNLPPKILVVHRFTQPMVTNYKQITPLPEVQIVMDMDGWGPPAQKIGTYQAFIASAPVQFTGFKLFYKNDIRPPSTRMLTPAEILKLTPQPSFIQYQ
ncbi:MAG: hypothetical protein Q7S26_03525 [bacterium]|nr:hypothetical protein [bacterium]